MPDLLFELRCEELPPKRVQGAAEDMQAALLAALSAAGLRPARGVLALWSPRRLALYAKGVPDATPASEETVKGPPERAAFDADGAPTRAATGFARKHGQDVTDLVRADGYVHANVRTEARPAIEVVASILPTVVDSARWGKRMRWGVETTFARPIRGVCALFGRDVVDCRVAGVDAGRSTRGHPFLAPDAFDLAEASLEGYVDALRDARVLIDPLARRNAVADAVRSAAANPDVDDSLLDEVTNLVEWPSAVLGSFDPAYLELPDRLLVTVMAHHQRFFPVLSEDGERLQPQFVAVLDRAADSAATCQPGFERVLVPRLHDAQFFFREDRKRSLEDRLPALDDVVYHRKLGTLREKAARLEALAPRVAELLGLGEEERARAGRAGLLAKCDLVTLMVGEFPELQGHVGSVYAAADGEHADVSAALDAQYRHEFADDETLGGPALALLLAENLDVLCQFGARVGLPTGSADPFGVRRAALTFLTACERWAPDLPLASATEAAGGDDGVREYLDTRLRRRLRTRGARPDHLDAIRDYGSVGEIERRIADIEALAAAPGFDRLLEVAERCRNITKKAAARVGEAVRPELLAEPAEKDLHAVWAPLSADLPAAPGPLSRADVARLAAEVAEPLHKFFEDVFVNAEDADLRRNRHALLLEIDGALLRFADLCCILRS